MIRPMQRMSREGRITLAGYDKNGSGAHRLGLSQELQQPYARHFDAGAMQIEAPLDFDISTRQALLCTPVEAGDLRW